MTLTNSCDALPYALWELKDGEVIVDRFYHVIAERRADGTIVTPRGGRYPIQRESTPARMRAAGPRGRR